MDPPWHVDPEPWSGERWILTQSDYLDHWRDWFCGLGEAEQASYKENFPPPTASAQFYIVFGIPKYDPVVAADKHRDAAGRLPPPWIAFPHIPLGSIGWRMGSGEDYWIEFAKWYRRLRPHQKLAFQEAYPEPAHVDQGYPWTGFYDRLEN